MQTGVTNIIKGQNQTPLEAFTRNQIANQQIAIELNQQLSLMQESLRMEQETQFLNTGLIPFPHAAQDAVSEKLADFYNQNQAIWHEQFSNLQQQKTKLFSQFHFAFDTGGNPVLDETGFPQLYGGAETPEQEMARQRWESAQQSQIQQNAGDQKSVILKNFTQSYMQAIQNNIGGLADPQVQAKLKEMVYQGEMTLQDFEHNVQLNLLKAGLPTPALQEKADELSKKFRDQESDFWNTLKQTPEAAALDEYREFTERLLLERKASLLENAEAPAGASPALLSALVPTSQNPDLAEAIQNAVNGAGDWFRSAFHLK